MNKFKINLNKLLLTFLTKYGYNLYFFQLLLLLALNSLKLQLKMLNVRHVVNLIPLFSFLLFFYCHQSRYTIIFNGNILVSEWILFALIVILVNSFWQTEGIIVYIVNLIKIIVMSIGILVILSEFRMDDVTLYNIISIYYHPISFDLTLIRPPICFMENPEIRSYSQEILKNIDLNNNNYIR